jgi:hypothetical protein
LPRLKISNIQSYAKGPVKLVNTIHHVSQIHLVGKDIHCFLV